MTSLSRFARHSWRRRLALANLLERLHVNVLNALNDTAEECLATENPFSTNFGQQTSVIDPRRAMVSVRLNLGR